MNFIIMTILTILLIKSFITDWRIDKLEELIKNNNSDEEKYED